MEGEDASWSSVGQLERGSRREFLGGLVDEEGIIEVDLTGLERGGDGRSLSIRVRVTDASADSRGKAVRVCGIPGRE